jgi:UDP-3-O-[3-hydroxymyristoyl] glucosamine N-acyltransferase
MSEVLLRDIIERLGGELIGDPATRIASIEPLESATPTAISFLSNPLYAKQLAASAAACVIVAPTFRDAAAARGAAIVAADPYLYFARLTQWWAERTRPVASPVIHPTAAIHHEARIGDRVDLGAFAVVEAGAIIGDDARIGAHSVIGAGCRVGAGTRIAARVAVLAGTSIGARCIVGAGALVPEGKVFEAGHLLVGAPARIVRALTDAELQMLEASALHYAEKAALYALSLRLQG